MIESAKNDECFIVVKAQPHRSSRYSETVCCAGIGRDGRWRRQYPVPFRILNDSQKFRRWDWITYTWVRPKDDRRQESQKVDPSSLVVSGSIKRSERTSLLNPLVRKSFREADENGESLTLLRPRRIKLAWLEKSDTELEEERAKHRQLANQLSLFDTSAKPLEPCPFQLVLEWEDHEGKNRRHECDDWETSAAFGRFQREYGREEALDTIKRKYEDEYFESGLALAFSTHKRRNLTRSTQNQWLLVGMIRLDHDSQSDLFIS